jgi:hypothetical protein
MERRAEMSGTSHRTGSKPVTRHCDECQHFVATPKTPGADLSCGQGHQLRFYHPRSQMDYDWGWKRACDDYRPYVKTEGTR